MQQQNRKKEITKKENKIINENKLLLLFSPLEPQPQIEGDIPQNKYKDKIKKKKKKTQRK